MSRIDTESNNPALLSLIDDYSQIIPMDACVLIPPDRSRESNGIRPIDFLFYKKYWLETLFKTFPHLAIHEAVLQECFSPSSLHHYLTTRIQDSTLILLRDSDLSPMEEVYRKTIEKDIAYYTSYNPEQDNKDDRGEVKTLAYIKTKEYLYFCSRDSKALRLIKEADKYNTHLQNVGALHFYEVMYYLVRMDMCKAKEMKPFYKYVYHLSRREKEINPEWIEFLEKMDRLYGEIIMNAPNKPIPLV